MKKTSLLICTAAFALLLASCQKEEFHQQSVNADRQVFTCTLEGDKTAIDADNNPVWQPGDFIILYNGDKANSASKTGQTTFLVTENSTPVFYINVDGTPEPLTNNIVEKIDITADMISADGKTVTFTKSIDDAQTAYYAIAENAASHLVYAIRTDGKVTLRESKSHTDTGAGSVEAVHAAVATCPAGSTELTFKNVYCQLKFDVSEGKYQRVTFEANEGSATPFVCGVNQMKFDATDCGTAGNKTDPYTIYLKNKAAGPYYVPVAPCVNLDKGITIKCYKSDADTEPYVLTISKKLPVERNRIINLGNLDDVKPITSYYEAWEEGRDILINGVRYNKSAIGAGRLITKDTAFATDDDINGAIFVAEGVTLSMPGDVRSTGSAIIMCDKPGKTANFVITGGAIKPQADHVKYIVNSMNVSTSKNAFTFGKKIIDLLGFYNCKLALNATNFCMTATSMILNTEIVGCDIKTTVADAGIHDGSKKLNKFETIIFNNNIVYSADGTLRKFCTFRQGKKSIVDEAGVVEMKNNTFYDINFNSNGLCSPASIDSFVLENNIFAFSSPNEKYMRCLWISTDDANPGKTAPVAGYPSKGRILNNIRFNTQTVLGCMYPGERLADKAWYATDYKEITTAAENPFSTADAANGIFTQKSAFAAYGAQR